MPGHPHLNAPAGGYVILVTYGRSGSTLVQNVMNAIPGYCIRGENANALSHLARAWHGLAQQPAVGRVQARGRETDATHPWYGAERLDLDAMASNLTELFVRDVLTLPPGTRVGGFKEVRFAADPGFFPAYMGFMRKTFPKVRFVYNTRDHAAVARSGWWARMPEHRVRAQLAVAEDLFRADLAAHPEDTLHLHYDDYTGKPEAFRPLFDFPGEPFDAGAVAAVLARPLTHAKQAGGRRGPADPDGSETMPGPRRRTRE